MQRYDYIIAGAGAAGLSLAYHLAQTPLRDRSILLIDKAPKRDNDHTWCFWERDQGPFEAVVHRQWEEIYFFGTDYEAALDLSDYRYKMIRADDFYGFVQKELATLPNIAWHYGTISDVRDETGGAAVIIDGQTYQADWVFDSRCKPLALPKAPGRHYLLQHFKGWEIQTAKPVFDPAKATFMDFRVEQCNEARFVYVLPLDEQRALVEFTVFSDHLLFDAEYEQYVLDYLSRFLQITLYEVLHKEFGVIPMTDHLFPKQNGEHIVYLGTAGGQTKASTGYTFRRIQQHSQALVQALLTTGKPHIDNLYKDRFKLYDSMLLNIMAKNRYSTKDIFTSLFKKNPPARILKFLDEDTTFAEDLKIMSSVPSLPFLRALADVISNQWVARREIVSR